MTARLATACDLQEIYDDATPGTGQDGTAGL
jgi:hypothetical protein